MAGVAARRFLVRPGRMGFVVMGVRRRGRVHPVLLLPSCRVLSGHHIRVTCHLGVKPSIAPINRRDTLRHFRQSLSEPRQQDDGQPHEAVSDVRRRSAPAVCPLSYRQLAAPWFPTPQPAVLSRTGTSCGTAKNVPRTASQGERWTIPIAACQSAFRPPEF